MKVNNFYLEISFLVTSNNEFCNVSGENIARTMSPWWVRSMRPLLYIHINGVRILFFYRILNTSQVIFDDFFNTSVLIYHLLSLSLCGSDWKDIRPYKRPSEIFFSLRMERTSSILTKASSSVFIMYLTGRILVCK